MTKLDHLESTFVLSLLEEASDVICVADATGHVSYLNRAARSRFGLGPQRDLSRLTLHELLPTWAWQALRERGMPEARTRGVWRGESALAVREGREVPVVLSVVARRSAQNETNYVVLARDPDHGRNDQAALLEEHRGLTHAHDLLAAIIRNAPSVAIQGYDEHARVTFWNPASERLYGFTESEALGKGLGELIFTPSEAETWEVLAKRTMETGEALPLQEWQARDKNGAMHWILSSSFGVQTPHSPTPGATRIVCMDVDISARIEAEQQLFDSLEARRVLEEQLVHAQKLESVGRLAGGVAHDFNNLLTVILGYSSLAAERAREDSELDEALTQIRDAADRGATLVRQLLAFGRRQMHQPQPVNMAELVMRLEQMLRRLIGEDVRLVTHASERLIVGADPGQLEQVLVNLAVNARDAMPGGGQLSIEMRRHGVLDPESTRVPELPPGEYAELVVSDTGSGMSDEVRQRAFEPFFTTKPFGEGTGLGLATCYGIVRQHGGAIWVESELGRGTTFHILLPLSGDAPRPAASERRAPALSRSATVLVVEDEPEVRNVTSRILTRAGLSVLAAGSSEEARQLMRVHGHNIHAVVSDIVMPGMSGPDLVSELRRETPELKVLFVSGYASHLALQEAVLDQRTVLLQKPFSPDALVGALAKLLFSS